MTKLIARIARRANDEEGLSVIELMVAVGILLVALLALAHTATLAFTDVAVARQRQTGAQLANRLLEEVRGLPYDSVVNGLDDADLAGDPNIVNCGPSVYHYRSCTGEEIVHTPGLPTPTAPLVPHQGQVGPPDFPSEYEWGVYVTEAADAPDAGALRVTVRVQWELVGRESLRNFVEAQTLIYSPEGCVDSATHPFSAPCQPYFYGNGSSGAGSILTTGFVEGLLYEELEVNLLSQTSDAQMEQITNVEGAVNLPLAASVVDGVETTTTPVAASSAADDDPSTGAGKYSQTSTGPQAADAVSIAASGNELRVDLGGGTNGVSTSTTEASTTNTCTTQIDGLPCGYGTSAQTGAIRETLFVGSGVGESTLVSVGALGTTNTTYVRRLMPGGTVGLVRETVSWSLPDIRLGGLPSRLTSAPPGWEGYWVRLFGFTVSATAEAGPTTAAPTLTIGGGTVRYWNGSGYTNQAVTASGGSVPITPLDFSAGNGLGNTVRVQMAGNVTIQPSSTSQVLDGTDRLQGKSVIGTPLIVEMTYHVTRGTEVASDLAIAFDAGGARASALYQPTP